jgi:hypothetical protein
MVLAATLCAVGALCGALLSEYTRHEGHWAWHYVNGILTIGSWAWMTKCSTMPLMLTSAVWDVTYTTVFTVTLFVLTRNELSGTQIAGAAVTVVGLFLLSR